MSWTPRRPSLWRQLTENANVSFGTIAIVIFLFVMLIVGTIQDSGKHPNRANQSLEELQADRYRYEDQQKRQKDYIEMKGRLKVK